VRLVVLIHDMVTAQALCSSMGRVRMTEFSMFTGWKIPRKGESTERVGSAAMGLRYSKHEARSGDPVTSSTMR
jgi:hypothetical protein